MLQLVAHYVLIVESFSNFVIDIKIMSLSMQRFSEKCLTKGFVRLECIMCVTRWSFPKQEGTVENCGT